MKKIIMVIFLIFTFNFSHAQTLEKELLIRCDDMGMSHAVNMAFVEMLKSKLVFSASIMFACPWYPEAVEILKQHPEISKGIHLMLNSEWKNYRWSPAAGAGSVPSLVDSNGFFFGSRDALYKNNPKTEDVEKELRAQIKRALNSGLKIDYMDYHMGTAVDKPEYRQIVEKLSKEFGLAISRYFGETDIPSMYSAPIENKKDSLIQTIRKIEPGTINLLVCHIGKDTPELEAMIDLNSFGLKNMSKHRNAELNSLLSPEFRKELEQNEIKLIDYKFLINNIGLENMRSPVEIEEGIYK